MLTEQFKKQIESNLADIESAGLTKPERVLASAQGRQVVLADGRSALNFCANNYLGLAGRPELAQAAAEAAREWGFGLASVRFICGTQAIHKHLEQTLSAFLGTDDTILYSSCFDANGGLFETLLGEEDAVISDERNHASIIDGVRLCKAARYRYRHADMGDLEAKLKEAGPASFRLIATDGVFSMDGDIAPLHEICELAERHQALVMVDDSHATGCIGATGRGTVEHCGVSGLVDLISTTFGKALGGAAGGCISGRRVLIELLRQRSRPYLFSNSLPPAVVGGVLKALEILQASPGLAARALDNARLFRNGMQALGFSVADGETAIVPVILFEESLARNMAARLLEEGIYVIGFSYPVVPRGKARIRVQLSAAHEPADIEAALAAFSRVGREMGVIR